MKKNEISDNYVENNLKNIKTLSDIAYEYAKLAEGYNKAKLYDEALEAINLAIELNKTDCPLYKLRAEILNHLGQWSLAEKDEDYILERIHKQIEEIQKTPKDYKLYKELEELINLRSYKVPSVEELLNRKKIYAEAHIFYNSIDRAMNRIGKYILEIEQYIKIFESFYEDMKESEPEKSSDILGKINKWRGQVEGYMVRVEIFQKIQDDFVEIDCCFLLKRDNLLRLEKICAEDKKIPSEFSLECPIWLREIIPSKTLMNIEQICIKEMKEKYSENKNKRKREETSITSDTIFGSNADNENIQLPPFQSFLFENKKKQ